MQIEVVYKQSIIVVDLKSPANILEAIKKSNILTLYPEIDLSINKTGIFGEMFDLNKELKAGDRVEIYRPLLIDPMERRFERVKKERKGRKQ